MSKSDMEATKADPASRPEIVGFLLIDGFPLMTYAAAVEPLRAANSLSGRELYQWRHISLDGRPAEASNGARILADHAVGEAVTLDTLFVCAGGNPALFTHAPTLAWLRRLAQAGVRIGGLSGGPYILARAGLLHGRRCTIHWEHQPALAEEFPELKLQRTLFEIDRDRLTCAGGVAALDLALALIEQAHGHALAAAVGEWYLLTQVREGGAAQRMALQERFGVSNPTLLQALTLMEQHIEDPIPAARLAELVGVSPRQLERLFAANLGAGPARHYLSVRLERAQTLLRQSPLSVTEVGMACGFVSPSHFSRAYRKGFGRSPARERGAARGPKGL
jgi:transcriptional regulator GlxA family with amidase domain